MIMTSRTVFIAAALLAVVGAVNLRNNACADRIGATRGNKVWCKCNVNKEVIGADGVTGPTRCVDLGGGRVDLCKWDAAAKECVPSKETTLAKESVVKKCAFCAYWDVLSAKCEANTGGEGTPKMCAFALACKKGNADRPRPCKGDAPPTTTTVGTTTTTETTTGSTSTTSTTTTTTGTPPPSAPTERKM